MFTYSLFWSVFYFNEYELTGSAEADPDLICFKTDLLLIILIICCWIAAVTLLIYL